MASDQPTLQEWVSEAAERLAVPGVAVGVYHAGEEHYAFHGVTSLENPLPVDEHTLFQFGSTGKTFTATAIMRLVDQGRVDLDATVRTYLPELRLQDEDVAQRVTVLQLLNHTAGWSGDVFENTGDGDDALARYVEAMAERRTGHAARRRGVLQQRLAVDRRADHREGHREDVRAGDPRAALRTARPRPLLLLPQRDHDAAVRRRAQPARRRLDHGGPAVGAGPQRQPGRRHLVERRRPDRLGPLPPRRRAGAGWHRGPVREAARPDEGADRRDARQRPRRCDRDQLDAARRRRRADGRPRRRHARPALDVRHGSRAAVRHLRPDQLRAQRQPVARRAWPLGVGDLSRRGRARSRTGRPRRRGAGRLRGHLRDRRRHRPGHPRWPRRAWP